MAVHRSWEEIRLAAARFAADWGDAEGYERGQAQEFVRELFGCFGIPSARITAFEQRVARLTGGRGYIDAFIPGLVLVEMKSRGRDLDAAQAQAFEYLETLPERSLPQYVIVSDFGRVRVVNAASGALVDEFALAALPDHVTGLGFLAGYAQTDYTFEEQEAASVEAARLMASLYEALDASGYPEEAASRFMVRLLYCLYADDAGLFLPEGIFGRFVLDHTRDDGSDLGPQLSMLFQVLDTPEDRRQRNLPEPLRAFPYVNGGLFAGPLPMPALSREARDRLLVCSHFEWSQISPAIFGSLFQAVKSKEARRQLGEHYTTERNILKLIGPLFMDELRGRYAAAVDSVARLRRLQEDLGRLRFLDPACGCGNFLVIGYRELRDLELDILKRLQELDPRRAQMSLDAASLVGVRLEHFAGIEIEEWPATIAATALHLVEHQANRQMEKVLGLAPPSLPLIHAGNIKHGNALRTDWSDLFEPSPDVVVMGNPPFAGHATRSLEQADDLRAVWDRDDIGRLDYVTGWYAKAIDYFGTVAGRWSFVSTNSITQGEPVPALFGPVLHAGWRIRFAHRTFAWSSEAPGAAAVHCVIVGFDREPSPAPLLFDYPEIKGEPVPRKAASVNPYLVDAPNLLVDQRRKVLSPVLSEVTFGNMPRDGGNLIVEPDDYSTVAADPVAAKYLRPFVMGRELINGTERWCLWLVNLDPADLPRSPILRERTEAVRAFRAASRAASTRGMAATPHLFGQRSQPEVPYLGIPAVFSQHRSYATVSRLEPYVIAGNKIFTAPDPDGLAFAVLSSSMFITWQKTVGGRLKNDCNFSNTIVWNNFPLPPVPDDLRARIIEAGRGVLAARALHPERSLAEHYNPLGMDSALVKAHDELDAVVDRAFGARRRCADNLERQSILFRRYAELTAGLVPDVAARKARRRPVAAAPSGA